MPGESEADLDVLFKPIELFKPIDTKTIRARAGFGQKAAEPRAKET